LVGQDDPVEPGTAGTGAVLGAPANEPQIVHKQGPDDRGENRVEGKPHKRVAEVLKGQDLHQGAEEIEEVMHELERPADEGEGVDEGARPEEQDGEKGDAYVGQAVAGPLERTVLARSARKERARPWTMLASVSSMLTMTSSSSARLAGGDFTTRVVAARCAACQRCSCRRLWRQMLFALIPPAARDGGSYTSGEQPNYRARTTSFFVQAWTC
jgi:hypothetical protein